MMTQHFHRTTYILEKVRHLIDLINYYIDVNPVFFNFIYLVLKIKIEKSFKDLFLIIKQKQKQILINRGR